MKITHYENGDSEFEVKITVRCGFSDNDGTLVDIGNLLTLNIVDYYDNSGSLIQILKTGDYIGEGFKDRNEALEWILTKLGGNDDESA